MHATPHVSRAIIVTVTATLLSGCVRYSAPVDAVVERGDLRVRVQSVSLVDLHTTPRAVLRTGEVRVVLLTETVPPNAVLAGARLTPGGGCPGGVAAERIGRSARTTVDAPLAAAERLTLAFPDGSHALGGESPGVALLLRTPDGQTRCVPVPLSGSDEPVVIAADERFTLGFELGGVGFAPNPGPTFQVIAAPATFGAWVGDYHLAVGAGAHGAGCAEPDCPVESDEQNINYATGFIALAGVGRSIWRSSIIELHMDLRYRLMTLPSDTHMGRTLVVAHGATLEPSVGVVSSEISGVEGSGGSREALIGLGFPIGYVRSDRGGSAVFGIDLRGFFTVL